MTKKNTKTGTFVFSLDFELFWGVHHNRAFADYAENLFAARENLPVVSLLFRRYGARFTCATVGLLYAKDWAEVERYRPEAEPSYVDDTLSPYPKMEEFKQAYPPEVFFAPDVLDQLRADGQEMATHTFAHYFCQEAGASVAAFAADLRQAKSIAAARGDQLRSIVFPRNQFEAEHLRVCREQGILAYRGNPTSGLFDKKTHRIFDVWKRVVRLLDSLVNLTGHNCYTPRPDQTGMINVPASAFLRPGRTLKFPLTNWLHLRRIKRAMTYAAKKGQVYHLWCHPHNISTKKDISNIESLLIHYRTLAKQYGFTSATMGDFLPNELS